MISTAETDTSFPVPAGFFFRARRPDGRTKRNNTKLLTSSNTIQYHHGALVQCCDPRLGAESGRGFVHTIHHARGLVQTMHQAARVYEGSLCTAGRPFVNDLGLEWNIL